MAKRFARGLANIRDPVLVGATEVFEVTGGGGTDAEVTVGLEADGATGLGADGASGADTAADASSTKSLKAATSDSFSTIIHTS